MAYKVTVYNFNTRNRSTAFYDTIEGVEKDFRYFIEHPDIAKDYSWSFSLFEQQKRSSLEIGYTSDVHAKAEELN